MPKTTLIVQLPPGAANIAPGDQGAAWAAASELVWRPLCEAVEFDGTGRGGRWARAGQSHHS